MKLIAPYFDIYAGQKNEQTLFSNALKNEGIEYYPIHIKDKNIIKGEAYLWQAASGYHQKLELFNEVIQRVESNHIPSINSPELLRWNANKIYLQQLENNGISIILTIWIKGWDFEEIKKFSEDVKTSELIIKPSISAGAYLTFRFNLQDPDAVENIKRAYQELPEILLMVQPFCSEIMQEGEWSLLYFDGEFSHAVIKKPKQGDYRIQHVHGGSYERAEPSDDMKNIAEKVIKILPEKPVYARVDGLKKGSEFLLMEVELIEPYFYLDAAPEKAALFAKAVKKAMQ